ncbi:uncharacterized protein LOC125759073 [Rhipicephalus sanguineus]|uniref:uncharacterized protein LOC125759073 n=1 Tax=Rhipicephalus sanguineus TaxID=34632 RepID=UPI0020C4EEAD|nr:uncharacterized protein LOC125759073 [Rhipicephalus sanguineus]
MGTTSLGSNEVKFKVDTGSQANIIPYSVYRNLRPMPPAKHRNTTLRSYDGTIIGHIGVISQEVVIGDRRQHLTFYVSKKGRQALLGLKASEMLGLVTRTVDAVAANSSEQVMQEFGELFEGTGCVPRHYTMVLSADAVPVVQAACRVPLALKEPLRSELKRMEQAGVVVKVNEPTEWEQHDQRLRSVLAAARQAGLKLNAKKCKVGIQEIEFLGDIISKDCIKPK